MLSKLQTKEYWDVIIKKPIKDRSIEELDVSFQAIIDLELSNLGSSGFDSAFFKNKDIFPLLSEIRDELISRNEISKIDFNKYILGCNLENNAFKIGRWINLYSLTEFISLCKIKSI